MNAQATFSSVLAEHSALEELFGRHQRALLTRDLEGAVATLKTFENALGRHIFFEDEVLLPLYASKGAEVAGGTLSMVRQTEALDVSQDVLGAVLRLMDDEALFKGLFAHHALREENLLFPRLDACTTEGEKEKALRQSAF